MANIKLGAIVTDIRGKLGGTVFSRGGGGSIVRNWTKPTNPRSNRQEVNRAAISSITYRWNKTLTQDQRDDWNTYAANTPWVNSLGQAIVMTGIAAFVRLNGALLAMSQPFRQAAPTAYGLAGNPVVTFTAQPTNGKIVVAAISLPYINNNNEHYVAIYQHMPVPAGREAKPGAKQIIATIASSSGAPPALPLSVNVYYPVRLGERQWLTAMYVNPYFQLGTGWVGSVLAADPI
jgi:hypothetical protein